VKYFDVRKRKSNTVVNRFSIGLLVPLANPIGQCVANRASVAAVNIMDQAHSLDVSFVIPFIAFFSLVHWYS